MRLGLKAKLKLRHWLMNDSIEQNPVVSQHSTHLSHDTDRGSINFNILDAHGGRIVQVQTYDRHKDRGITSLHIVTPDEDLAQALTHILSLVQLSR